MRGGSNVIPGGPMTLGPCEMDAQEIRCTVCGIRERLPQPDAEVAAFLANHRHEREARDSDKR